MQTNDATHYEYVFRNAIRKYKRQSFLPVNDYNLEAVALPQRAGFSLPIQQDASYKLKPKSLI